MATITLHSMTCVKLQDSITSDEIKVFVGGVHVGGPFGVHKGETVNLGIVRNFTGSTSVQLREVDSNSAEDNLGLRAVLDNSVTHGNLIFDAAKKAYCAVNSTRSPRNRVAPTTESGRPGPLAGRGPADRRRRPGRARA